MMAVDIIVLSVVLLSALLALARGLLREVFSLAAWIGAGVVAYALFKDVSPLVRAHISSPSIADGVTALGLFAISLLALLIVGHLIAGLILRGKAIGMIDRTLGLVFGAARGALIMTLVYLGSTWIWPPAPEDSTPRSHGTLTAVRQPPTTEPMGNTPHTVEMSVGSKQPIWLSKAQTRPFLADGAALLVEWMPTLAPPKQEVKPANAPAPPFNLQLPMGMKLVPAPTEPQEQGAPDQPGQSQPSP